MKVGHFEKKILKGVRLEKNFTNRVRKKKLLHPCSNITACC